MDKTKVEQYINGLLEIHNALNVIEVKGKQNLTILVNSMTALTEIAQGLYDFIPVENEERLDLTIVDDDEK